MTALLVTAVTSNATRVTALPVTRVRGGMGGARDHNFGPGQDPAKPFPFVTRKSRRGESERSVERRDLLPGDAQPARYFGVHACRARGLSNAFAYLRFVGRYSGSIPTDLHTLAHRFETTDRSVGSTQEVA